MIKRMAERLWQGLVRIFSFVNKEIRAILHQPRLVFSLILGPFFILLIFGVGYREEPRTLNTLFVVPEGSEIETYVEEYTRSLDSRVSFAGMTADANEADNRLRAKEVDLVVVTPLDPISNWENDEQAKFSLYHSEIDPVEEVYIQVLGQRYVEMINQQVLMTTIGESQQEAIQWQEALSEAKNKAADVRQALAAGNRASAQNSARDLKTELDGLTLAIGAGTALAAGFEGASGRSSTAGGVQTELVALREKLDELDIPEEGASLQEEEAVAADIETSLEELDGHLTTYRDIDAAVLVAPFRSESLSVTQIRIEPMQFYVPAVIALVLQHLAITLAGLSIIR